MRIERLRLAAYGRFTDVELDLSAPGLHVVFGANGTGKTTALHAVPDLLYGVPERTRYGFLHGNPKMALGAVLRDEEDRRHEVLRRKGRKETLLDADGVPVPEARIAALLGGVARGEYESSFVLTQDQFREGGRDLAAGQGSLGRILFQARGLRGFTEALASLRERKKELYLTKGHKPKINGAIAAYQELRRQVRDHTLSPGEYERLTRAVEAAGVRAAESEERLRVLRTERERWHAVRVSLVPLRRRAEASADADLLAQAGPFVPLAAGEVLAEIRGQARRAEQERLRLARELDKVRERLAAVFVDENVLAHAAEIDRLHTRLTAVAEDHQAVEDLTGRLDALRAHAERAVAAACPGRDLATAAATPVPAEVRTRITALAGEHEKLAGQEEAAKAERARRDEDAEDAAREVAARLEPPADAGLRAVLDAVREAGRPEKEQAAAARECERLAGLITAELVALRVRERPAATADALPLPGRELVEAVRQRYDDRAAEVERLQAELDGVRERDRTARRRLEILMRDANPPTERELTQARERRDAAWRALHDLATGPTPHEDGAADAAVLSTALAEAITDADALADRMRREAAHVSERNRLEVDRDYDRDRIASLEAHLAELDGQAMEIAAAWEALWRPVELESGPDYGDAAEWHRRLVQLGEQARTLREKEAERARLAVAVDGHRAGLARELSAAGVKLADEATLAELMKAAERRLEEIAAARQAFEQAGMRIARAEEERVRAAARTAELARERDAWAQRWSPALVEAGLAADAAPADAVGLLDGLAEAQRAAADVLDAEREAARRAERIAAFGQAARAATAACGLDVGEGSGAADAQAVVAGLHELLSEHQEAEQTRRQLTSRHGELTMDQVRAEQDRAAADERLSDLLTRYHLTDDQEIDAELDRARRHADRTDEIAAIDRDLADVGIALGELRRLAADQDAPALDARVLALDGRLAALQADHDTAHQELGERRSELARHDGSAAAADAQGRANVQLATAVEHAEEYLRLHLAETLLVEEIDRYRAANQNLVLARGAELFARLSVGEYPRLEASTDDDGEPVLHAHDAAGTPKRADQLNEGARDQLYLALRLATLDSYAAAGRRLPFLLDDVLVSFDDTRTPAALDVLSDLAATFQVVVLTHHESVAHAAACLGPQRASVHTLARG